MNQKRVTKLLSWILSSAVMCGGAGILSSAGAAKTVKGPELLSTSVTAGGTDAEPKTLQKEETVYVIAGADGSVQKVIVSDWIRNMLGSNAIDDVTQLENIQNVKGEEGFAVREDGVHVWDAQGNDIYYQGNISKELPVDISVSYRLDGKPIAAQEIAGKSGAVTIRFDYTNRQYETVTIDGEQTKIYVPFAVLTGFILDNAHFRNIAVSNGKIVNDGDHTIVAGIAFPGLSESLALDPSKLKIPDFVEITADVENFAFGTSYTLATNEVFNKISLEDAAGSVEELKGALANLTDAVKQLTDGSSALYEGLAALQEKSAELVAGIGRLAGGAGELSDGSKTLVSGVSDLQAGASGLANGLHTIASNSESLNAGAKQVFASLLAAANTQIAAAGLNAEPLTIENYTGVLEKLIASLNETDVRNLAYHTALQQVEAAVRSQESNIALQVREAARQTVLGKILAASGLGMTAEEYTAAVQNQQIPEAVQSAVSNELETQMQGAEIQAFIARNTESQIQSMISNQMQSNDVASKIDAAVEAAKQGRESLSSLQTQLDSYRQFYEGLLAYTAGVDAAGAGAGDLIDGINQLQNGAGDFSEGAAALYAGALELQNGVQPLIDGIAQLKGGAMQLSGGLKEFNEQGVQKLADAAEGGINGLLQRIRAVSGVSRSYKSFAGIADGMGGSVRFLYKTAPLR